MGFQSPWLLTPGRNVIYDLRDIGNSDLNPRRHLIQFLSDVVIALSSLGLKALYQGPEWWYKR